MTGAEIMSLFTILLFVYCCCHLFTCLFLCPVYQVNELSLTTVVEVPGLEPHSRHGRQTGRHPSLRTRADSTQAGRAQREVGGAEGRGRGQGGAARPLRQFPRQPAAGQGSSQKNKI